MIHAKQPAKYIERCRLRTVPLGLLVISMLVSTALSQSGVSTSLVPAAPPRVAKPAVGGHPRAICPIHCHNTPWRTTVLSGELMRSP
jgi:hypothetical protein